MKTTLQTLSILLILSACSPEQPSHKETVATYYKAFDTGDYNTLKTVVNDTLTIVAGDYTTPYTQESFYTFFTWDSIFKTRYTLIDVKEKDDQVMATVRMSNVRNSFLKNDTMSCTYKISFAQGKISTLEDQGCPHADWDGWATQRDSLVNWVSTNHPELNGFINDMTMDGAINYLQAINLYEGRGAAQ